MRRQNVIDALNRLLLVVEGLPDSTTIVSVEVYTTKPLGTVHVMSMPPTEVAPTRTRVGVDCVRLTTAISGVEVYSLVNEPVPEDA